MKARFITHQEVVTSFLTHSRRSRRSRHIGFYKFQHPNCSANGGPIASAGLVSEAEHFIDGFEKERGVPDSDLRLQHKHLLDQIQQLQQNIDELYSMTFVGVAVPTVEEDVVHLDRTGSDVRNICIEAGRIATMDEFTFGALGRECPELVQKLVSQLEKAEMSKWLSFQSRVSALKLQRSRVGREASDMLSAAEAAEKRDRDAESVTEYQAATARWDKDRDQGSNVPVLQTSSPDGKVKIVLITGFESFNVDLYKKASVELAKTSPNITLRVFSDRDVANPAQRTEVEDALRGADVFFGSLLFDFDQVEWIKDRVNDVAVRLIFESALELMSCNRVGSFEMASGGTPSGPPPAVKKVLSMFSSGREEDKMVGYLSFLKVGPKLLKFLPNWAPQKVKDLRTWLTVYSYWNQGGIGNVVAMLQYLAQEVFPTTDAPLLPPPPPPKETPATGLIHPLSPQLFDSPQDYMKWYEKSGPVQDPDAPAVAVLLYRKHVITEQPYIGDLVACLEAEGLKPLPIFINGVEAHTIVRDVLTTQHEQQLIKRGIKTSPTLERNAIAVDAIVNTIGFPLVGGPAGTMEGGRQAEVAKAILSSKNVPYIVAAPLLIQDLNSWVSDGIAGLQSVVLYSLPELDGAIDTVPLGGLVGDNIYLIPERVKRLSGRLKKWIALRRKPAAERKVAILLYGFPPGVGATGTAALLNVPRSLEHLLKKLDAEGYDVGGVTDVSSIKGEAIVEALSAQTDQRALAQGAVGVMKQGAKSATDFGAQPIAADVSPMALKEMLTFPRGFGPTEWGPIPFLPEADILVQKVEKQWGELGKYRGLSTSNAGDSVISGLQFGNVFIGVQPLLGVEGDPMRMLFERDLTPHPQYAAFYRWLQQDYGADAVLHFGMHGTVEWLPGAPLGNSGFSWSDVLLGDLPNVYVYAANNPSESIVAKRRGYGTIVSHNVPPYGRAGLYKQLAELKALLQEYRENADESLQQPIMQLLSAAGLQEDCPATLEMQGVDADSAAHVPLEVFKRYASRVYLYLQEVETRVFSEGLHVLGQPPRPEETLKYLSAYFGEDIPENLLDAVAHKTLDIDKIKFELERTYNNTMLVEKVEEAVEIRNLLDQNTQEIDSVLRALNGEYILPEAGGDLLRDGAGVLPTGRNIYALDPYRMPGPTALARGAAAAEAILQAHKAANNGAWPQTVAVNLWGLDAIKTKGETVAMALHFVGARPVKEGTGRIARFELIPLEELGRPRVDVLCNLSGIFRDSFQNVVELLDDMFQRAAAAKDEPDDMNFIKKHATKMSTGGLTNPAARLFSNPAGDYGSMVNERVGAANWEDGDELGTTWVSRNAFSYGRGGERGTARPEILEELLTTTDRIVQEVDSVEYGLTDIQEYYANTGALRRAAEVAGVERGGKRRRVGCSIVEAFEKDVKPRELEEVLRLEYRSKLLNPKWAEAMAAQGSGGAFEISQRMTAMLGWGATAGFAEDWTWDQAAETYAFDEDMAKTLRETNPQAFANVVRRMLEAAGRGMWKADDETVERLQKLYAEMDDKLEGV